MLFYISYCSVFFFAILAAKTDIKEKVTTEKSEAIFADVIKNISRVNNVLQELINNYEQLQKIYKSQENFDGPEYSSETDGDVDRYFNNNKKSKRDKERSFNNYVPTSKTTGNFLQATQMIFSENEDPDEGTDAKSETANENTLNVDRTPLLQRLQDVNKKSPVTVKTTTTTVIQEESSDESSTSEESKELSIVAATLAKTSVTTAKPKTTSSRNDVTDATTDEAEIIFVDTHKKAPQQKKPRIMPEIALEKTEGNKKPKTRYSVKETYGNKVKDASYGNKKVPGRLLRDGLYNVSTTSDPGPYLQVEFIPSSSTAWSHDPITHKLKQLILSSRGADGKRIEKAPVNLRTQTSTNKTMKVLEAKGKDDEKGEEIDTTSQMTDDDAAMTKDLFKTSVLRQAYGDACLKVVVRKCYKACKGALTTSCRSTKCKGELKEFFDRSSRSGCILSFNASKETNVYEDLRENKFIKGGLQLDMTRAGYLSVACLQETETGMPIPVDKAAASPKPEQNKELNILRDRYEKACQRASQEKCDQACSYAHNATCYKYECNKQLKKNFRRNCKTQCKNAYSYRRKSSSSSSSSSSSDSSSSSS